MPLIDSASYETIEVMVCTEDTTVMSIDGPDDTPLTVRLTTLVLDRHVVTSFLVLPMVMREVASAVAAIVPTTVTETPPVAAVLVPTTALTWTPLNVTAWLKLNDITSTVLTTPASSPKPPDALIVNPLSDCHAVDTTALPPNRAVAVSNVDPNPRPTNVTDRAPVEGPLLTTLSLVKWSRLYETIVVDVNDAVDNVDVVQLPLWCPAPALAITAVLDCHTVDAVIEPLSRVAMLPPSCSPPNRCPTTVTLVDPVDATLVPTAPLMLLESYDIPDTTVDRDHVIVNIASNDDERPDATLHSTLVSLIQVVTRADDPPIRTSLLTSYVELCTPTMVTLVDPVAATFVWIVDAAVVPSYVTTFVTVTTAIAIVVTTCPSVPAPSESLHRMLLSAIHTVVCATEPPARPDSVTIIASPLPIPTIVTLIAPVVAWFDGDTPLHTISSNVTALVTLPRSDTNVVAAL
jgi:hypothetical protein